MKPPLPTNEKERLERLRSYAILDTTPETDFDDVASLASLICATPTALVTFIDEERQWFKSKIGFDPRQTYRDYSFCAYSILGDDILEVPDAQADPRFADNPLVTGEPGIRFYAGVPLITKDGYHLGAVSVIDNVPRSLTDDQRDALRALARVVMTHLDSRLALVEKAHKEVEELREETRSTRALLSQVVERVSDGIIGLDRQSRFTYVTPVAAELLNRESPEVLLGKDITKEFAEEFHGEFEDACKMATKTQQPKTVTLECKTRRRWFEYRLFPSPDGLTIYIRDITAQVQTEEEKRRLESQVMQSQKMEAIGVLAGGIAHDFNNLLQIIRGCCSLALEEGQAAGNLRANLEQIQGATDRASQLTRQLLLFGRREVAQRTSLDLASVVQDLLRMLERAFGPTINFEFRSKTKHPFVQADRGQVEQVLMNLCINSRDAMNNQGSLSVEICDVILEKVDQQIYPWAKTGRYVVLAVKDSGTGMDSETLSRIYEPFFTTKPAGQGSGLGLAVVYGIVRQHEGLIEVESAPNRGCTVRVFFPAAESAAPKSPPAKPSAGPEGTETILLVEDEPGVRRASQMLLERSGYRVLVAVDGQEAVEIFEREADRIELVLTDVVMPRMSGFEAAARIQEIKEVPVVFCSGYAARAVNGEEKIPPGAKILAKPYPPAVLRSAIREALDNHKSS